MYGIIVKTQFEGIHKYPEAPKEVEYLKYSHRHIFYVEVEIETFHDDRELEFIMVKHALDEYIGVNKDMGRISCEQIAKRIQEFIKCKYETPLQINERNEYLSNGIEKEAICLSNPSRLVNVKVFEDNENGAFIKEF